MLNVEACITGSTFAGDVGEQEQFFQATFFFFCSALIYLENVVQ